MTAVIVLFVGVILAYHAMLYSETRQRIVKTCELSAVTTAEQIDRYLSTGIDTMRLACYTLDNMIRDGRSQQEIKDFLLNQSAAVINITSENSPGLYGYINGEYLDGTGWTPDPGYDPTVRPWYIDARANIGRVAVVDPYVDLDSGTVMIALSKTLCDARSVAAMDFSIDYLQSITEELAAEGESHIEIVLDRKYQVIVHSDRSEVGKNYAADAEGFGGALVRELRSSDEGFFSLAYGGKDYIVHSASVANSWRCLSVFDATDVFRQMRKTLIFTIFSVMLVVVVLLHIMARFNRKERMEQQLMENLSQAKSDIREKDGRIGEISRVAFRDALTGVGSKAAFNRLAAELTQKLKAGTAVFSVVMMDINNLKYVNDAFGHDVGDDYIRGCCKIMCDIYKHSSLFRIGGDEFVAVLQTSDYENRTALAAQLENTFAESAARQDSQPWERYSAVAGTAEPETGDTSFSQVLKRADQAMYAAKQAYKAKHGSYR
ncbi:MAG: diguanylate cyclase [Oscillospiraceae bacterium]|nr:diguanylate cyclase [Oscillospiraceae bacterium]